MRRNEYSSEIRDGGEWPGAQPLDSESSHSIEESNPHHVATRGFAQVFGLHPAVACATVACDFMLQAGDIASMGLLIPFSAAASIVLGSIVFLAQKRWYEDDNQSAFIKALIVTLLTALPSPLPYILFVPAGLVGFFRGFGRR